MAPNPAIMQAVEQLGYRVTVGDVATQAGFDVNLAQQGLLALATDVGGHMQVADSGEIVYLFPKNMQAILRNKFLRLRLQAWWNKVWRVLFYLIRISFGVLLLASIALIFVTIFIIITASNQSSDNNRDSDYGGGGFFMPYFWIGPNWYGVFYPDYDRRYQERRRENTELNFFEAIFSFLFGDGNPNADLEERRQKQIAAVIRNHRGAVVAEQIAPYLDDTGTGYAQEYEDYMLPVLTKFDGQPQVSPQGDIVYVFPQLQTSASQKRALSVPPYLQELPLRFSAASSGQIVLSAGLGVLNLVGALFLGGLLADGTVAAGGIVGFAQAIYWLLLGYGTAFLGVPLIRYFFLKWRNAKISDRNAKRQERSLLIADPTVKNKINYAKQFAAQNIISKEDLVYTTETDLIDQEIENSAQIDAEWQRRLRDSGNQ